MQDRILPAVGENAQNPIPKCFDVQDKDIGAKMRYQVPGRTCLGLGGLLIAAICAASFLCVVLNPTAANANHVASSSKLALQHARAPRYVQKAADNSGIRSLSGAELRAFGASGQTDVPGQNTWSIWHRRHTKGFKQQAQTSGTQSASEGGSEASGSLEQPNVPDQKTSIIWQRRHIRGVKQKEIGQKNPEKISAESQKDLIDIMNPKQN